jgi:hypothetical protein
MHHDGTFQVPSALAGAFMILKLVVWMCLGLYVLLSAADWVMTHALLRAYPEAMEANPLAAACLEQYGWHGLALYKAGGVFAFVGAVFLLVRRRPVVAAGVAAMGCAVLLSVTFYTHGLICEAHRDAAEQAENAAWPKPKPANDHGSDWKVPLRCCFAPEPVPAPATTALRK